MTRTPLLAIPVLLLTLLAACDAPQQGESGELRVAAPATRYSLQQLMDSTAYRGLFLSPDGSRVLTSSDASGIFNLVELPVDGSEPWPLTDSDTITHRAAGYFPSDDRILFSADRAGDEQYHLYVRNPDGSARADSPSRR